MKSDPIKHFSDASGYLLIFGIPEKLPDLRIERNQFHPLSLFLRHIHTKTWPFRTIGRIQVYRVVQFQHQSNINGRKEEMGTNYVQPP